MTDPLLANENLTELTGKHYYAAVDALVEQMAHRYGDLNDPSSKTEVLAIARGGLIPATYVVYRLRCPLNVLYLRSYNKPKVQKEVELYGVQPFRSKPIPKRILVVDDIQDTGKSFDFVQKFFQEKFAVDGKIPTELVYCVVVHRVRPDIPVPDIYGVRTTSMDWVKFPYEPVGS